MQQERVSQVQVQPELESESWQELWVLQQRAWLGLALVQGLLRVRSPLERRL